MNSFIELAWTPFLAVFWWFINRMTSRIDLLESEKADVGTIGRINGELHEIEKRLEKLLHTTVPRPEFKADIGLLHQRCNELSNIKEDKVKDIRLVNQKQKDKEKS